MSNNEVELSFLYELFEVSCQEVFDSLGLVLKKAAQAVQDKSVHCAYIEADSNEIKLLLILRGPVTFLKKTYPIQDNIEKLDVEELDDWISELANRFMGNLKNNLLAYDHAMVIGTPIKEFGTDIDQYIKDGYSPFILHCDIGYEVFELGLYNKILNKDIKFQMREITDDSEVDDGELEFF